jgi:hypothetical protein
MDLFDAARKVSGIAPPEKPKEPHEIIEPEVMEEAPVGHPDPFDLERLQAELMPYKAKIGALADRASQHIIKDEASNVVAVDMGIQLSKLRKDLEAARIDKISRYDYVVRGVNKLVKDFRDVVDKGVANLKGKIGRYQQEQREIERRVAVKKAAIEAEARRKQMAKDRADAQEKQRLANIEAARKQKELDAIAKKEGVEKVEVIPEVIEIPEEVEVVVEEVKTGPVKTSAGTSSHLSIWKYDLMDISEVPRMYSRLVLNEQKVKEDIAAGCRVIPGLRIYEETQTRFRTK